MRRSLSFFWRSHLAVGLGAAVTTAVLTGALVVGDSVRGSLRALALGRLGAIDEVLVGERLVSEELAGKLAADLGPAARVAPAIVLSGAATHGGTGARAASINILGVDEHFSALFPASPPLDFTRREGQVFPSALLSAALAEELGARAGDELLLSFESRSEIPRETLVGRSQGEEGLELLRLSVAGVLPEQGPGAFGLSASQARPQTAFVELPRLARALGVRGRVNALLAAGGGAPSGALAAALARHTTVEDLGVELRPGAGALVVESAQFVLSAPLLEAVSAWARQAGSPAAPVLSYLANEMRVGARLLPYSTVAAVDPAIAGRLTLAGGGAAPPLAAGQIYLNTWAAEDLGASPGSSLELTYFRLGPRDELSEATAHFTVAGVVELAGLAADPSFTPEFPGMSDAENMANWDPPFPVDLKRVRPRDEAYWDAHRATPKAFIALATGQELWRSRFGEVTSLRLAPPAGETAAALAARLGTELPPRLSPPAVGLTFRPVREQALTAASGGTDFAGLFLGMSLFLIVSAALLAALLFRLGVEQRAREVGLLAALGMPARALRRRFLAEGALVAGLGVVAGLAAALAYAELMLYGLKTWWLPAIGTPFLSLYVSPGTLAAGACGAFLVILLSILLALRGLLKVPAPALLAGAVAGGVEARGKGRARAVALSAVGVAFASLVGALFADRASSPALTFLTGTALLVAGLAAFAHLARTPRRRANGLSGGGALVMAARAGARSPGRSLLSVALVASASFLIVAVGANRGGGGEDLAAKTSGAGGFALWAESAAPLYADLNRPERRAEIGVPAEAEAALSGVTVFPLRFLPGDDASCLNLYRPQQPRVLGVPKELIERGGFTFQKAARPLANPWALLEEDLGPGVVPAIADANSAQWILKKGLGDDLTVVDEQGRELRLRLVGLLAKSLFQSEILISEGAFERHFPSRGGYRAFLIEAPAGRAVAVGEALEAALPRFGFDAVTTAARLEAFHAVESTYMATFTALGGLGLILGTVGLAIILLRNVLERRGELAALRAFGWSSERIRRLVVAETLFLLLLGLFLGTAAALVAVAPRLLEQAAGLPWLSLAATLTAVAAVGLLACLAAVRAAMKVPLLPALRGM